MNLFVGFLSVWILLTSDFMLFWVKVFNSFRKKQSLDNRSKEKKIIKNNKKNIRVAFDNTQ